MSRNTTRTNNTTRKAWEVCENKDVLNSFNESIESLTRVQKENAAKLKELKAAKAEITSSKKTKLNKAESNSSGHASGSSKQDQAKAAAKVEKKRKALPAFQFTAERAGKDGMVSENKMDIEVVGSKSDKSATAPPLAPFINCTTMIANTPQVVSVSGTGTYTPAAEPLFDVYPRASPGIHIADNDQLTLLSMDGAAGAFQDVGELADNFDLGEVPDVLNPLPVQVDGPPGGFMDMLMSEELTPFDDFLYNLGDILEAGQ